MKHQQSRTNCESEAVMTMTAHLWLRLRCVGLLLALFFSVALNSPFTFAYDGCDQTTIAYDGHGKSSFGYDVVSMLRTDEKNSGASGNRVLFGGFDEFLAAKTAEQGRDALGRFLPKAGGEVVPGSLAEQAVWDAIKQKPGWNVIEGRVSVRNAAGDLRIYDGAAVSPRGRVIGIEVKSGGATRTGAQSAFDAGVNTFNPAVGVGENAGLEVGRSLLIRRP